MGRRLVIVMFLACCGLAIWVFLKRDTTSVREQMEKADRSGKPRMLLGAFKSRRYDEGELNHSISASHAELINPNLLEVEGQVKAWRRRSDGRDLSLSCERALAHFAGDGAAALPTRRNVELVQLEGLVKIDFADHALTTEAATYQVSDELVIGEKPVRVAGPGRWFSGRDGFKLQLKDEALDIFGPVRGMVTPDARQKPR